MTRLFEHESIFELADTLETLKEEIDAKTNESSQLKEELLKELLFRWMQFDDKLDDCASGIAESQYIYCLEQTEAVDFFALLNLPMNAEHKQFEEALAALLSHINECSVPRDQQAQLTTVEVKKIFNQLENRMSFCTKLFPQSPLPVLKLNAVYDTAETQYAVRKLEDGQVVDGLIVYHNVGEKCLQRYAVLRGLGYVLSYRLTGQMEMPPDSFQLIERSIYEDCEINSENRMKRFIDCFACVGAKMVDGTHCFPIEGIADPDIDQLTYYFKALLDSE